LKLDEALNIAMQVADGLQAAHEKKITHRDIKPANVMMTNKGQAKIMDFGLAKLAGRTVVTKEGMTLGTVAYMSPEQGRGEEVDHRTDIWAFGVVLYEMITGQLPFRGEYEAAMMYSLMNENPEPLTGLRTGVPMELERLVNKCLEKQAAHRYQHADDLLADLRRLKNETGRVSRQLSGEKKISDSRAAVAAPRSSQKKRWLSLGALAVLAIVVSVLLLLPQRSPELNPNMTFRVLQTPFTEVSYPGWSADGNWLAFPAVDANGKWDVYFMNTSGGEPRRITADSSDYILSVDVSPDGARVVYDRLSFRLRKTDVCIVPSLGGPSKVVVSLGGGVSWRPDGERIGYIQGHPFTSTSKSGRLELWSIKPDGSDNRLEFMDSTIAEMNTRAGYS
jgi:serine/threonine protein kinase